MKICSTSIPIKELQFCFESLKRQGLNEVDELVAAMIQPERQHR
jgi:hypothetical protein